MHNFQTLRQNMLAMTVYWVLDNRLGAAVLTFTVVVLCYIGESRKRWFF